MKKVNQLILIIAVLSATISCCEKKDKKQEEQKIEQVKDTHESNTVLQLNNGNLWLANSETTTSINNMIALMNAFSDKENIEAYSILKRNLEKEFNTIITECSMEGESHNQLHNYLIPIVSLFKDLESSELTICKESYNALNKHLLEYSNYFE